ncbi:MAG: hypothetical protein KDD48_08480 [Bdellovibrionales bacterium]|nr:hypothetical protein [Bdellovibrionales bacterium]
MSKRIRCISFFIFLSFPILGKDIQCDDWIKRWPTLVASSKPFEDSDIEGFWGSQCSVRYTAAGYPQANDFLHYNSKRALVIKIQKVLSNTNQMRIDASGYQYYIYADFQSGELDTLIDRSIHRQVYWYTLGTDIGQNVRCQFYIDQEQWMLCKFTRSAQPPAYVLFHRFY